MLDICGRFPENYLGPEPVQLANNPSDPLWNSSGNWFEIPSVREYFSLVHSVAQKCIAEFDEFSTDANKRFELLTDHEQEEWFSRSLMLFKEELPVRVLKEKMTPDKYQQLLDLLA